MEQHFLANLMRIRFLKSCFEAVTCYYIIQVSRLYHFLQTILFTIPT